MRYMLDPFPLGFLLAWCAVFAGFYFLSKEFRLNDSFYKRQRIRQALHLQELRHKAAVKEDS